MIVSVGDREADIYELFQLALKDPQGLKLLVRAEHDRLLADGQGHLWPVVRQQLLAGIHDRQQPAAKPWLWGSYTNRASCRAE